MRVLQCSSVISAVLNHGVLRNTSRTLSSACLHNDLTNKYGRLNISPRRNPLSRSNIPFSSYFHTSYVAASYEDSSKEPQEQDQYDERFEENAGEYSPHEEPGGAPVVDQMSISQRLRRLSMSSPEDYELSPMAYEKAKEMSKVRKEVKQRGEEWKWDQRNLRPGGPPQQGQGYSMRNWDDDDYLDRGSRSSRSSRNYEDDDFYGRSTSRSSHRSSRNDFGDYPRNQRSIQQDDDDFDDGYGGRRAQRSASTDNRNDGALDYEAEMQKLRERMDAIKAKKVQKEQDRSVEKKQGLQQEAPQVEEPSSIPPQPPQQQSIPFVLAEYSDSFGHNLERMEGERASPHHHEAYIPEHEMSFKFASEDPDTFGNLMAGPTIVKDYVGEAIQKELREEAKALSIAEEDEEEEEEDDTRFIAPDGQRWTSIKLITKVRELLKEKKLKEAIDIFLGVLGQGGFDFDHPELRHHFQVLINECAAVGYVDMAFRLFNLMKQRGYKEGMKTYSSLINACANSPWDKANNLEKIERLLITIQDRGKELNIITYTALIKAYGRMGEIVMAFGVVDKMIEEAKIKPDVIVFNMLLQACISDKKNGFRHALITWNKMRSMYIRPDIYSFNLLFRAIRDCGIEIQIPKGETRMIADDQKQTYIKAKEENMLLLPPIVSEEDRNRVMGYLMVENPSETENQVALDNLGDPTILDMKALKKALQYPENRFSVLGGLRGALAQMMRCKTEPNLKTLSGLLDIVPASDIPDILRILKTCKIKADVTFYTKAIARCNEQKHYREADEMVKLMNLENVVPNIMTYGALALGCRSTKEASIFLQDMDESKYIPDDAIMGSLLKAAYKSGNPKYFLFVMEEARRRNVPLTPNFISSCENFYKICQRSLVSKEMGKDIENKTIAKAMETFPNFAQDFSIFKMRYPRWLESVEVAVDPKNPWKEEFEHFKEHKRHKSVETEFIAIDVDSEDVSVKN